MIAQQHFDAVRAPVTEHSGGGHSGGNTSATPASTPSASAGRVDSIELKQMRVDLARMEGLPVFDDDEVMRLRRSFITGLRVRIRNEEGGCAGQCLRVTK